MAFLIAVTLLAIVATGVVALRDHALPSPRPLADIARDAFTHGNSQAALALSAITTVSAVILGIWAPYRPPTAARCRPPTETPAADTSTESSTP